MSYRMETSEVGSTCIALAQSPTAPNIFCGATPTDPLGVRALAFGFACIFIDRSLSSSEFISEVLVSEEEEDTSKGHSWRSCWSSVGSAPCSSTVTLGVVLKAAENHLRLPCPEIQNSALEVRLETAPFLPLQQETTECPHPRHQHWTP